MKRSFKLRALVMGVVLAAAPAMSFAVEAVEEYDHVIGAMWGINQPDTRWVAVTTWNTSKMAALVNSSALKGRVLGFYTAAALPKDNDVAGQKVANSLALAAAGVQVGAGVVNATNMAAAGGVLGSSSLVFLDNKGMPDDIAKEVADSMSSYGPRGGSAFVVTTLPSRAFVWGNRITVAPKDGGYEAAGLGATTGRLQVRQYASMNDLFTGMVNDFSTGAQTLVSATRYARAVSGAFPAGSFADGLRSTLMVGLENTNSPYYTREWTRSAQTQTSPRIIVDRNATTAYVNGLADNGVLSLPAARRVTLDVASGVKPEVATALLGKMRVGTGATLELHANPYYINKNLISAVKKAGFGTLRLGADSLQDKGLPSSAAVVLANTPGLKISLQTDPKGLYKQASTEIAKAAVKKVNLVFDSADSANAATKDMLNSGLSAQSLQNSVNIEVERAQPESRFFLGATQAN